MRIKTFDLSNCYHYYLVPSIPLSRVAINALCYDGLNVLKQKYYILHTFKVNICESERLPYLPS